LSAGVNVSPATIRVQAKGAAAAAEPVQGGVPMLLDAWDTMSALPGVGLGVPIIDAAALEAFPFGNAVGWSEESNTAVIANLREAFAVLQEYAPEYLPWVRDSLRYVVPLSPPAPDVRRSYSVKGLHGVVFMSFPASPLKTAETLVHECAHQHYHLAEEWFRLANGRDERSYYSVYVRKERPIDRVLIAFHAFANVVLFHRACIAANAPFADACASIVAENEPHLAEFKTFLGGSNGLTKAGRAIWEPVMARMES
jgi:HEXXH motif-containing protein